MNREINLFEKNNDLIESDQDTQQLLPEFSPSISSPEQAEVAAQVRLHIKRVIEALLFVSSEPLPFHKIREITDTIHPLPPKILRSLLQTLHDEYMVQQRAFRLEEIAQGFILRTREEFSPFIELLGRNKRTEKLSQAAAEALAIIAYKQPITRPQIDAIRGVDSSGIICNLLERQLIQPLGKLEVPGRPTLYGITKEFLHHFGLKDIKELQHLENHLKS